MGISRSLPNCEVNIVGGKRQIDCQFIPTDLFRGCPLIRGFVCVYIYIYIYIYNV